MRLISILPYTNTKNVLVCLFSKGDKYVEFIIDRENEDIVYNYSLDQREDGTIYNPDSRLTLQNMIYGKFGGSRNNLCFHKYANIDFRKCNLYVIPKNEFITDENNITTMTINSVVNNSIVKSYVKFNDIHLTAIQEYTWHISNAGYVRSKRKVESGYVNVFIHNIILHTTDEQMVDHLDRDKLNNIDSNLRPVTSEINNRNASKRKDNVSGIVGVYRREQQNGKLINWVASWPENKKKREKFFSVNKYGEEVAKQMAIEFRQQKCIEFNINNG